MGNTVIAPSGEMVTENRCASGYTALSVRGGVGLNLRSSKTEGDISLEGDKAFLEHIKTEVRETTLHVWSEGYSIPAAQSLNALPAITLRVDLNAIEKIDLAGEANLTMIDDFAETKEHFALEMRGCGLLYSRVDAAHLTGKIRGGGCLRVASKTALHTADYDICGSGNVDALAAPTAAVKARMRGTHSEMKISASQTVDVDYNGSGTIYVCGEAAVNAKMRGEAKLVRTAEGARWPLEQGCRKSGQAADGATLSQAPPPYEKLADE